MVLIEQQLKLGDIDSAYQNIIANESKLSQYDRFYNDKASVCAALSGYDIALKCFEKSLSINCLNPDTYEKISKLYSQLGISVLENQYLNISEKLKNIESGLNR